MKKALLCAFVCLLSLFCLYTPTYAETNDFYIIPKVEEDPSDMVERISNSWWKVRDQYDYEAYEMWWSQKNNRNLWQQMASWVMTRDTLIDYTVYALRFMSQISLIVWALMFIYNGYQYVAYGISWENPSSESIKHAVIWILIVIFSYALMRILTRAFLT